QTQGSAGTRSERARGGIPVQEFCKRSARQSAGPGDGVEDPRKAFAGPLRNIAAQVDSVGRKELATLPKTRKRKGDLPGGAGLARPDTRPERHLYPGDTQSQYQGPGGRGSDRIGN